MDVLEIVLTMLSMAGAVFAWYQANGSKKARAEAADAVSRAEVQAKSAFAQAYEARKQAEAAQKLADSLQEQVEAAKKSAVEAGRLADSAEESNHLAEKHLAEFRRMADSLRGPEFMLELIGKNSYRLSYSGDVPVKVSVLNLDKFLRVDGLDESFEIHPHQFLSFFAFGAWGHPIPDRLVLSVQGRDAPIELAMERSS